MQGLFRISVCFSALAIAPMAALADGTSAAQAFSTLCVHEGFKPNSSSPPAPFPNARMVDKGTFFQDMPADLPFELLETWQLDPAAAESDQLFLAVGFLDHPTLGEMVQCIILAPRLDASVARTALIAGGAEEDGRWLFMSPTGRLWMVSVSSAPTGEGTIMGMTVNKVLLEDE